MKFSKWMNSKISKEGWQDIALIKLCVFFFALMIAKLWSPILSLEWYWYGLLFIIFAIKPFYSIFRK